MTNAEILGNKIYELRKRLGISQEELADMLGVSRQAISKWERGEAVPDTDNLISIAKLFKVSLDELVGNTENSNSSSDTSDDSSADTSDDEKDFTSKENLKAEIHDKNKKVKVDINSSGIHVNINNADDNEDDDDDFDIDDIEDKVLFSLNEKPPKSNNKFFNLFYKLPYAVLVTVIYLLWGCLTDDGWAIGWTLYLTLPVYDSILDCFRTKKLKKFNYAFFVTFIFCLFGMIWGIWHPLWVIFITIPIFYSIT